MKDLVPAKVHLKDLYSDHCYSIYSEICFIQYILNFFSAGCKLFQYN